MQNRILVTGGSGQLAREMLKLDKDLLAPSREEMDVSSYDAIEKYCAGWKVSIVIHAAAVTNKFNEDADEGYLLSNIIGTANVVLWCRRHKARLVYVSSDYVYPGERGGYSEESPLLILQGTELCSGVHRPVYLAHAHSRGRGSHLPSCAQR